MHVNLFAIVKINNRLIRSSRLLNSYKYVFALSIHELYIGLFKCLNPGFPIVAHQEIYTPGEMNISCLKNFYLHIRAAVNAGLDLKLFLMNRLGIPQERISERLGIPQKTIHNHLAKMPNVAK